MRQGRRWRRDVIPISSFMRRRDIPRVTRVGEQRRAYSRALLAFLLLRPSPGLFLALATVDPSVALVYWVLQSNSSGLALDILTRFIPRPLTLHSGSFYRVPFHLWAGATFSRTFRVESVEVLERLRSALGLPHVMHAGRDGRSMYTCPGLDALAVTLARLSYPNRLHDLLQRLRLNWSLNKLSSLFNGTVRFLCARWKDLILFDERVFRDTHRLRVFADAIHKEGSPFVDCCGFIDGTTFAIARPISHNGNNMQAAFYSGHHREHCLRFQCITCPDGSIASCFGPHEGK